MAIPQRQKEYGRGKKSKRFTNAVEVEDGKFEKALRTFKRKIEDSGLLFELRERQHYVKPCIKRKLAKQAAKRRWQKKVASEQLPKKLY
jgi:small subunit ribosomal protein S21